MTGVRAYVLARKGVLVSSPDVKNMTSTQWLFEYYALSKMEQSRVEDAYKLLKNTLVSVLGLNMLRPADSQGRPKEFEEMTPDERDAFLPLVTWCARPDMLKPVVEQYEHAAIVASATNDADYEALCAQIDENVDDIEPILGIDTTVPVRKIINPMVETQLRQLLTVDNTGKV
jgi:hypothetical protein